MQSRAYGPFPIAVSIASAAFLVVADFATAQPVADCKRARNAAERAICMDPHLAAADSEMAKAYSALRALLPTGQHAGLLDSQREWIAQRDGACQDKGSELTQCLWEQTQARRRFLAGEGPNAGVGALRLLPAFHREAAAHYTISIEYPQIPSSAGANAAPFNEESRKIAFGSGPGGATAFRNNEPMRNGEAKTFYDESYEIRYLDAHLASIVFAIATYEGGAHPNGASIGVLFDFDRARPLRLGDFLVNAEEAIPAIAARCEHEATEEDWGVFENADFAAVVSDIAGWTASRDGVAILFNPYSVTPYVAGPHECRIPYTELARWLKPGGPLPPHPAAKE
jgi:uncharacterized protein YecT (DUF1311 family)